MFQTFELSNNNMGEKKKEEVREYEYRVYPQFLAPYVMNILLRSFYSCRFDKFEDVLWMYSDCDPKKMELVRERAKCEFCTDMLMGEDSGIIYLTDEEDSHIFIGGAITDMYQMYGKKKKKIITKVITSTAMLRAKTELDRREKEKEDMKAAREQKSEDL